MKIKDKKFRDISKKNSISLFTPARREWCSLGLAYTAVSPTDPTTLRGSTPLQGAENSFAEERY